ncbi:Hypothetical predicted protein, partial [Podarcis lilfordi]
DLLGAQLLAELPGQVSRRELSSVPGSKPADRIGESGNRIRRRYELLGHSGLQALNAGLETP